MATFFSNTSIGAQAERNNRKKKVYNILDNRPPLNFFKGNIFTKINLQNIQYLFLCFFQLIFHEHHAFLYAGVIGLGARGIYLAAYFLQYERKLLSFLGVFFGQQCFKIIAVIFKAHLLFGQVYFFYIIDQLLLHTVGIIILFANMLFEYFYQSLFYLLLAQGL